MKTNILAIILMLTVISCEPEPIVPIVPDLYPTIESGFTVTSVGSTEAVLVKIHNIGVPTTLPTVFYLQKMPPVCNLIVPAQSGGVSVIEEPTRYKITLPGPIIGAQNVIVILQPLVKGSASLTATVVSGTGGGESPWNNNITSFHFTVN